MSAKVPTELLQSIYNLLSSQGYEKSASSLIKEAGIKKSADVDDLNTVFTSFKSNKNGAKPAAKAAPAKKAASSSSESSSDSDSDDEAPAKKPVPVAAKKTAAPVKKADSSSSSSSSDSSSEDEKPVKKPVPVAAKAPAAKATPAKKADTSSSSDSSSSSSEDEKPAKKSAPVAAPVAAKKAAAPVKKADSSSSSSSSSESSSSEDEKPKAKAAAPVKAKAVAPIKKPASSSSSSSDSDSSSSSDEEAPPKKVAKKEVTSTPAKSAVVSAPSTPSAGSNSEHKIYVKGLPWLASEAEVKDFFKDCGSIVSTECPMGEDGRSTGTAYVKFADRNGLEAALALDGQLWPGTERWLKIQEGFEKPTRSFEVGAKPEGCDTVFVGNLPWEVTEEDMREIFGSAGDISSVRFAQGEDGTFRGFGHVSYYDSSCVDEAVKLAGTQLKGRAIRVDFAPPRNRESFGGAAAGGRGGADRGGRGGRGGADRGGRGGGRGAGRGGPVTPNKSKGSIAVGAGKKMTFDE